jgi:murein DD-endopeptidase MepM/ murein hydrolase activator NlpD
MKSDKTYNVIITGNHKSPIRMLTLSRGWIHFSLFVLAVTVLILIGIVGDYFHLVAQSNENKILKVKNEQMEKQYVNLAAKLSSLELQIEKVKSLSTKLKAITDVSDEDRELDLVFNTDPRPGENIITDKGNRDLANTKGEGQEHNDIEDSKLTLFKWPLFSRSPNAIQSSSTKFFSDLEVRIMQSSKVSQKVELNMSKLWDNLSERRDLLDHTPSIYPAYGWVSSHFGYRNDPFTGKVTLHKGLDVAGPIGTPVFSPAAGVVSYVGYEPGYGKIVSIDHGFGVVTRFAHNSKVFVKVGQQITRRDKISAIGNTGRSSGPHVHYEVRVNGIPVDPKNYVLE